jgi:hypothetical protein
MKGAPFMADQTLESRLAAIGADGFVSEDEVLYLRNSVFADGIVSAEELDALFELGARAREGDPEWLQFFAEAAADFYLREEEPAGYLTAEEFQSLKARVTRDGHASALELALLVKLMETAELTPPDMAAFVGEQLRRSIADKPGGARVGKSDAMLLRRYLFAAGGAGNVAVTRAEAELLFDINDAAGHGENDPAWPELFVQGIVNHLMAHLGYTPPSREEAFRRDAFMRDSSVNVGGFFKRMMSANRGAYKNAFFSIFKNTSANEPYKAHNQAREADAAIAAQVTADEAAWLAERIGRNGALDENERRLIERMREHESELPAQLRALLKRAA